MYFRSPHSLWLWYSSLGSSKVIIWFIYIYRINRHKSKHKIHIKNDKKSQLLVGKEISSNNEFSSQSFQRVN